MPTSGVEQRADDLREVVPPDAHIAVGDDQIVVARASDIMLMRLLTLRLLPCWLRSTASCMSTGGNSRCNRLTTSTAGSSPSETPKTIWNSGYAWSQNERRHSYSSCSLPQRGLMIVTGGAGPAARSAPAWSVARTHGERGGDRIAHGRGGERRAAPNHPRMSEHKSSPIRPVRRLTPMRRDRKFEGPPRQLARSVSQLLIRYDRPNLRERVSRAALPEKGFAHG